MPEFNKTIEDVNSQEMLDLVNSIVKENKELRREIETVKDRLKNHGHYGYDETQPLDCSIDMKFPNFLSLGNSYMTSLSVNEDASNEINFGFWTTGKDKGTDDTDTTANTQIQVQHDKGGNSFMYGFRPPIYISTAEDKALATSGGTSTLTDPRFNWTTNELVGSFVHLVTSGSIVETLEVASNTATVITFSETATSSDGNYAYTLFKPMYVGAADYPWRKCYVFDGASSGLQIGIGTSSVEYSAYNAGTTYDSGDYVSYSGAVYVSLQGSNTGNTPGSSPSYWSVYYGSTTFKNGRLYNDGGTLYWLNQTGTASAIGGGSVPTATVLPTARTTADTGFLLCDGSAISRTTYSALFSAIGTTYGAGDGSTTFNIPDLRGRVPVGKNSGTFSTLGSTGGAETHTLSISEMPSHDHPGTTDVYKSGGSVISYLGGGNVVNLTQGIAPQGGGGAHNNLQPYQVFNYQIKT